MSYEVYARQFVRRSEPTITLNARGRLVFNVAATKIMQDASIDSVFLMWDAQAKKFAVRAINKKDSKAFTVRFSGKDSKWAAVSAKGFLAHIGHPENTTKAFPATWNDELMMFEVDMGAQESEQAQHRDQEQDTVVRRTVTRVAPRQAAMLR